MMPQRRPADPSDRPVGCDDPDPSRSAALEPTLSERLREATRSAHRQVERSTLMTCLLRGRLARPDYAALLANLGPIYAALERELGRASLRDFLAPPALAGLARAAAIERDLEALRRDGIALPAPRPAGLAYVRRLGTLGAAEPVRLVAHAYVRYLGDLAGGQVLARIVGSRIGAPTNFYDFGLERTVATRAEELRNGLDRLALDDAAADAVVEEALWAFDQHGRLFEELAHESPSCAAV